MAVMESIKTMNSVIRTLLVLGVAGGLGYGGYVGYEQYVKPGFQAQQAIEELAELREQFKTTQADLERTRKENDRLQTSLKLLKVDRRLAQLKVLEKTTNDEGEPVLLVRFTELDQDGMPVGAERDFELRGDRFYIDCWVVKFQDKYVEQADALRAASLCVFKSIFGDLDGPAGAQPLDVASSGAPGVYRDDRQLEFERKIWEDFWNVSNNPDLQDSLGIRASHGEAIYVHAEPGMTYNVSIRSSGATSLEPVRQRP